MLIVIGVLILFAMLLPPGEAVAWLEYSRYVDFLYQRKRGGSIGYSILMQKNI